MSYNQDKEEFIKYLQFQKHYSINTVESYQRSLNEFIGFLKSESISHFNDVKYTNIRGYLTYLNESVAKDADIDGFTTVNLKEFKGDLIIRINP